jgi:hypothetical protein
VEGTLQEKNRIWEDTPSLSPPIPWNLNITTLMVQIDGKYERARTYFGNSSSSSLVEIKYL